MGVPVAGEQRLPAIAPENARNDDQSEAVLPILLRSADADTAGEMYAGRCPLKWWAGGGTDCVGRIVSSLRTSRTVIADAEPVTGGGVSLVAEDSRG